MTALELAKRVGFLADVLVRTPPLKMTQGIVDQCVIALRLAEKELQENDAQKQLMFYEQHTAKQANELVERDMTIATLRNVIEWARIHEPGQLAVLFEAARRESCPDCAGTGDDTDGDPYNGFTRAICRSCEGTGYR